MSKTRFTSSEHIVIAIAYILKVINLVGLSVPLLKIIFIIITQSLRFVKIILQISAYIYNDNLGKIKKTKRESAVA